MGYFIVILVTILATGAAGYFFYVKKLQIEINKLEADERGSSGKTEEVLRLLDSIHAAAFGPAGIHPQVLQDLFNKLWKWAGLEQRGIPK
jgi:hypothetical protein